MASAVFLLAAVWGVVCCGAARAEHPKSSHGGVGTINRGSAASGSLHGGFSNRGDAFSGSSFNGGLFGSSNIGQGFHRPTFIGSFQGSNSINSRGSSFGGGSLDSQHSGFSSLGGGGSLGSQHSGFSSLGGGGSLGSQHSGFSSLGGGGSLGSQHSGFSSLGGGGSLGSHRSGFSSLGGGGSLGSHHSGFSSLGGKSHLGAAAINFQNRIPRVNLASNFFNTGQSFNSPFVNQRPQVFSSGSKNTISNNFPGNNLSSQSKLSVIRGVGFKNTIVHSNHNAQSDLVFTDKSNSALLQRQNARLPSFSGSSLNFGTGSFHNLGTISKLNQGSRQRSTFSSGVGNKPQFFGGSSQIPQLPTTTKLIAAGSGFKFMKHPSGFDTGRQHSSPAVGVLPGRSATSRVFGGNAGNSFGRIAGTFGTGHTGNLFGSSAKASGGLKSGGVFASRNFGAFGAGNTGNRFGAGSVGTFGSLAGNKFGSGGIEVSGVGTSGNVFGSGGSNRLNFAQIPSRTLSNNKNLRGTFVGNRKYSG